MNRSSVILAVVSALVLGVALGFLSGVFFAHNIMRRGSLGFGMHGGTMSRMAPPGPRGMPSPRSILPRLVRLLDLTPQQTEAIRGEIERSRDDFALVRDSLHVRIERHLSTAQRERWRRALREHFPGNAGPGGFAPHHFPGPPGTEGDSTP